VSLEDISASGNPIVVAASTRVKAQESNVQGFRVLTRGPLGTPCRMRVWLPEMPDTVTVDGAAAAVQHWDEPSRTLYVEFENQARDIELVIPAR